jgi:hypothetical protein
LNIPKTGKDLPNVLPPSFGRLIGLLKQIPQHARGSLAPLILQLFLRESS